MKADITPDEVNKLYKKLDNKHFFIVVFGTKRFHQVSDEVLKKMHDYLVKRVKQTN